MKVLLIVLLSCSLATAASTLVLSGSPQVIVSGNTLLTGLQGYWKLDEASGNDRVDSSGNGNTLDEFRDAIPAATGKINNGVGYTGGAVAIVGSLIAPDSAGLSGGDHSWTVAFWIKFNNMPGGDQALVSKDNGTNWDYDFYMHTTTLHLYMDGGSGAPDITWGSALTTGVWYDIVGKYDASADVLSLNVNQGTPVTTSIAGGSADTNGSFYVGRESAGGGNVPDATMDEIAMWNAAKSSADLNAAYGGGTPLPFASWQ